MLTTKKILIKRLKGKLTIDFLFNNGEVIHSKMIFIRLIKKPGAGVYLSGVSVPKKLFKKAIDRNRIKRQMRFALDKLDHQKLFEGSGMIIFKSDKKPLIKELIYDVDSLFSCIKNN